mmetsp:Transcript_726/g.2019  ORF Transcript_726/g.2019 Transcript_726/m.2019 type:complete len:304 (-) Transcript_726:378-1289(-)
MGTLRARALEQDPDKVIYGPNMKQRIIAACGELEELAERWEALAPARAAIIAHVQGEQSAAERAAVVQAEARKEAAREAEAEAQRAAAERADAERRAQEARAAEHAAAARGTAARIVNEAGRDVAPVAHGPVDAAVVAVQAVYAEPRITVHQALERLRGAATAADYTDTVQVALLLISNVHAFPEEKGFREVRVRNVLVQEHVARRAGGLQLLRALGFELSALDEDEPLLTTEEPNVELDFDKWAAWYDALKANIEALGEELKERRVAPLPTAVKGGIYGANGDSRRPAAPQVLTLHGSSGAS